MNQIFPGEGNVLNYRIVGFEIPRLQSNSYTIELAEGSFNSPDSFNNAIVKTITVKDQRIIIEVPKFGTQYTWRTVDDKSSPMKSNEFHHFSTGSCPEVDTNIYRLRLATADRSDKSDKDGYVAIDGNRVIYDMKGNPVWYLPGRGELSGFHKGVPSPPFLSGVQVTDMKLSPSGAITFILRNEAYEVGYDGEILWKAPKNVFAANDSNMQYHHELSRLGNGNYMVLSFQSALLRKNWHFGANDNIITDLARMRESADDSNYIKKTFGMLAEYSPSGQIVWQWESSKYIAESDLHNLTAQLNGPDCGMHENAFYFDESENAIYLSMKLCSRVVKIDYPSGKVLAAFGETYLPGSEEKKNGPFFGQHACKKSHNGNLYLFDNNVLRDSASLPGAMAFKEVGNNKLQKIWEFQWPKSDLEEMRANRLSYQSGGNIEVLDGNNIFIYIPGSLSKLYIVNHASQVLWSAIAERRDRQGNMWKPLGGYRASYCSRQALEALIWKNEDKKIASAHRSIRLSGVQGTE